MSGLGFPNVPRSPGPPGGASNVGGGGGGVGSRSLLRSVEDLERRLGSTPSSKSKRGGIPSRTARRASADQKQRMAPREFFNELPAILTNFFGLGQADNGTNIFTSNSTAACAEHLFYPEGPVLSHVDMIQREGKHYGLSLTFLPIFFTTKLSMEAPQHLPPLVQSMLSQSSATASKIDHFSPRPLTYFFIMFCMRALKATEAERLASSRNVYYHLLSAYLTYYVPMSDGQQPSPDTSKNSGRSPSLRETGTAALRTLNTATHVMKEQGFSSFSNIDHIWHASSHATSPSSGQCMSAEHTRIFLSTVLEMWLGQYLIPNPSRATPTHAGFVVMLVRWLQYSLSYHAYTVERTDIPQEQLAIIKARFQVIRGLYAYYLPALYAFLHTNLRPQHSAHPKAMDCLLKVLCPWKYNYPPKTDLSKDQAVEHVRRHIVFFTVLALQVVENIAHVDLGYDEKKWLKGKDATLNQIITLLNVFSRTVQHVTFQEIVLKEEESFLTSFGRDRVHTILHEQLQTLDPRALREYSPLFYRNPARTPPQLHSAIMRADKAIAASYDAVCRNLDLAKEREKEHIRAEITPQRLFKEPLAVINDIVNPKPTLNFAAHSAYRKSLVSAKTALANLFPSAAQVKRSGSADAALRRTVSGRVVERVDRSVLRQRFLKRYSTMRRQPVRSYEVGFLVHLLNRLSTLLNDQFEDRPWMYAYMTPHELKDFVAQHAVLGDGLFGVCPATQVDEGVKYNIYVSRDGMVEEDTLTETRDGGITLDGQLIFADVGELVAFYMACPYYVDSSGTEYSLRPIFKPAEEQEAHKPLQDRMLARVRHACFPVNLRYLADLRVWLWLLIPIAAWTLTGSLTWMAFVCAILSFVLLIVGLVAASPASPAPDHF